MFIVSVSIPDIGMHKWTSWDSSTYVIDANNESNAIEILRSLLPEKDPKVQKALCVQDGFKENEYFSIYLHEVPKDSKAVIIYKPNTGFNEPYKEMRI